MGMSFLCFESRICEILFNGSKRLNAVRRFPENCNAGLLSLRSVCRRHDEVTKEVQKSSWIKHPIDHECRERVGSFRRDVFPLLNSGSNIHAMCFQFRKEAVPV